jgi:uncharacterized protein YdiU (UPF0061 family)
MLKTSVDYTVFFRELSSIPDDIAPLERSFYKPANEQLSAQWEQWLKDWRARVGSTRNTQALSQQMKQVNPKYTWREWLIVPAYQRAATGDFRLIQELQEVLTQPYAEQSMDVESKFYSLRPQEYFRAGGVSHYSCSS